MKGYKTYLIAAAAAVVTGLHYLGHIDSELYKTALGFLGAGGLATIRSALPANK